MHKGRPAIAVTVITVFPPLACLISGMKTNPELTPITHGLIFRVSLQIYSPEFSLSCDLHDDVEFTVYSRNRNVYESLYDLLWPKISFRKFFNFYWFKLCLQDVTCTQATLLYRCSVLVRLTVKAPGTLYCYCYGNCNTKGDNSGLRSKHWPVYKNTGIISFT